MSFAKQQMTEDEARQDVARQLLIDAELVEFCEAHDSISRDWLLDEGDAREHADAAWTAGFEGSELFEDAGDLAGVLVHVANHAGDECGACANNDAE